MSANDFDKEKEDTENAEAQRLAQDIEATRATMSGALTALETRLSPAEVRSKVEVELHHVEEKLRVVVREQLADAKALVKEELAEAQALLREEMNEAESKVKAGLSEARDTVKKDLQEAITGAKRSVRAATLGKVEDIATTIGDSMNDTRDTLVDTLRQNPVPAALAGIGIAWLFMNRSSNARRAGGTSAPAATHFIDERGMPYTYDVRTSRRTYGSVAGVVSSAQHGVSAAADQLGKAVHGATHAAGSALHQASDATTGALHQASDAASSLAHQASDAAGTALHGAADLASRAASQTAGAASSLVHGAGDVSASIVHGAGDAASYVLDGARGQARRVEQGFQRTIHDNPLAVGAAAVAVGAVIGFALPRTQQEDALMGEARDGLLHQAEGAAHDAAAAVEMLTDQAGTSAAALLSPNQEATASE